MKFLKLTLIITLFTCSQDIYSQVFDLYELELYNKKIRKIEKQEDKNKEGTNKIEEQEVNNKKGTKKINIDDIKIKPGKLGIAEINSTLVIKLYKDSIAEKMQEFSGGSQVDSEVLKKLKGLLRNQDRIMQLLTKEVTHPDFEGLGEWATQMLAFYDELAKDKDLTALHTEAANAGAIAFESEPGLDFEAFIMNYLDEKMLEYAKNIQNTLEVSDVKFILTGSLQSKKGKRSIKLSDDFDDLPEKVYSVPRWDTSLSEDDKKELKKIAGFIDNIKKLKEKDEGKIKDVLLKSFKADDCLEALKSELRTLIDSTNTLTTGFAKQVKDKLTKPYLEAEKLVLDYTKNKAVGQGITNVDLLIKFNDDLASTTKRINSLVTDLDKGLKEILDSVPGAPAVVKLNDLFNGCKVKLIADIDLLSSFTKVLKGAQQTVDIAGDISDKVKRLGYNAIPDESYIDLTLTGFRENGDKVIIKAIVAQEINGEEVTKVIDQRRFIVQQIGGYSIVKPVLILANPIGGANDKVTLQGDFQFTPSYSMLFKWGSRKSRAFNSFWSPGIGINFSAPDFNTDGTPEFGVGLEISLIRDYLAFGTGYNFGVDEPFYFIGFRIPFTAVPLPILNNIAAQD